MYIIYYIIPIKILFIGWMDLRLIFIEYDGIWEELIVFLLN